jgi:hypothetical protein
MVNALMRDGVLPGLSLDFLGDGYRNALLINVTETKTLEDLDLLVSKMHLAMREEAA